MVLFILTDIHYHHVISSNNVQYYAGGIAVMMIPIISVLLACFVFVVVVMYWITWLWGKIDFGYRVADWLNRMFHKGKYARKENV